MQMIKKVTPFARYTRTSRAKRSGFTCIKGLNLSCNQHNPGLVGLGVENNMNIEIPGIAANKFFFELF